jgi:periplasmic protein TonB
MKSSKRPRESAAFLFPRALPSARSCGVQKSKQISCCEILECPFLVRLFCARSGDSEDAMVKEIAIEHGLFADSMLETSRAHRSRRGLSTLTSFGMQFVVLGLVILLSILKSVVMPAVQMVSTPVFLSHLAPAPSTARPHGGPAPAAPANPDATVFRQPSFIPKGIHNEGNEPSAPSIDEPGGGIYASGPPSGGGLPGTLFGGGTQALPVVAPPPVARQFRTSKLLEGNLIHKVQPVYPPLARTARVQGSVVLAALISKDGTIENLRLLSGHPMLSSAAIDAVKQWRYKPYILNGDAIEVETQITVNFYLGGN